jgi:ABC-type iron transport system FetAB ATPase subunit
VQSLLNILSSGDMRRSLGGELSLERWNARPNYRCQLSLVDTVLPIRLRRVHACSSDHIQENQGRVTWRNGTTLLSVLKTTDLQFKSIGPFNLSVASGECLAVAGPSGSGKSLLLRMIADLLPHKGHCRLDGQDSNAMAAPQWRQLVRYSGSEPGWWAPTIAAHFRNVQNNRDAAERLGLSPALFDAPPDRLSTGERQRFALLRAVEQRPRFLLLDEPTSALDHTSTLQVEALIGELMKEDIGIIIVSHAADQVERVSNSIFTVGTGA